MRRTNASDNGSTDVSSLGHFFLVLFFKCLSKHAQHMFYISSLCGQFNHYAKHRAMAASKLNAAMNLAYREKAIELPMAMHGQVWGNTSVNQVLNETTLCQATTEESLRALAHRVIDVSPRWIRYAPESEWITDVMALLRNQRKHLIEISRNTVCAA